LSLLSLFDISFVDQGAPVYEVCPSGVRPGLCQQSWRWIAPLYRRLHGQVPHAHEIGGGDGKGEDPADLVFASMSGFGEKADSLQPAKDFLNPSAAILGPLTTVVAIGDPVTIRLSLPSYAGKISRVLCALQERKVEIRPP
jgi:hypothetical protein